MAMLAMSRDSPLIAAIEDSFRSQLDARFNSLNSRIDSLHQLLEKVVALSTASAASSMLDQKMMASAHPAPPVLPRETNPAPNFITNAAINKTTSPLTMVNMNLSSASPLIVAVESCIKQTVASSIKDMDAKITLLVKSTSSTSSTSLSSTIPPASAQRSLDTIDSTQFDRVTRSMETRIASAVDEALQKVIKATPATSALTNSRSMPSTTALSTQDITLIGEKVASSIESRIAGAIDEAVTSSSRAAASVPQQPLQVRLSSQEIKMISTQLSSSITPQIQDTISLSLATPAPMPLQEVERVARVLEQRISDAMQESLEVSQRGRARDVVEGLDVERLAGVLERRIVGGMEEALSQRSMPSAHVSSVPAAEALDVERLAGVLERRIVGGMEEALSQRGPAPRSIGSDIDFDRIAVSLERRMAEALEESISVISSTTSRSLPSAQPDMTALASHLESRIAAAMDEALRHISSTTTTTISATAIDTASIERLIETSHKSLERRIGEAMQRALALAESESTSMRSLPSSDSTEVIIASVEKRIAQAMEEALTVLSRQQPASKSGSSVDVEELARTVEKRIAASMEKALVFAERDAGNASGFDMEALASMLEKRIAASMERAMVAAEREVAATGGIVSGGNAGIDVDVLAAAIEKKIGASMERAMELAEREFSASSGAVVASDAAAGGIDIEFLAAAIERRIGASMERAMEAAEREFASAASQGGSSLDVEALSAQIEKRIAASMERALVLAESASSGSSDRGFASSGTGVGLDVQALADIIDRRIGTAMERALAVSERMQGPGVDAEAIAAVLEKRIAAAMEEVAGVLSRSGGGQGGLVVASLDDASAARVAAIIEGRIGSAMEEAMGVVGRNVGGASQGLGTDPEWVVAKIESRIAEALDAVISSSGLAASRGEFGSGVAFGDIQRMAELVGQTIEGRIASALEEAVASLGTSGAVNSNAKPLWIDTVSPSSASAGHDMVIADRVAARIEQRIAGGLQEAVGAILNGRAGPANRAVEPPSPTSTVLSTPRAERGMPMPAAGSVNSATTTTMTVTVTRPQQQQQSLDDLPDLTKLESRLDRSIHLSIENATRSIESRILAAIEDAMSKAAMESVATVSDMLVSTNTQAVTVDDGADAASLFNVIAARLASLEQVLSRSPAARSRPPSNLLMPPQVPSKNDEETAPEADDEDPLYSKLEGLETRMDALPGLMKASIFTALDSQSDVISAVVKMALMETTAAASNPPERRSSILGSFSSQTRSRAGSVTSTRRDDDDDDYHHPVSPRGQSLQNGRKGSVSSVGGQNGGPRHVYRDPKSYPQVLYADDDDDFAPTPSKVLQQQQKKPAGRGWWG
ncbi:hypothetical protein HDU97_006274 [Phlyctochytrium planicorne]|nr:hypothetical protein HDU97_006274 [Phlyctochytrium planicorne]